MFEEKTLNDVDRYESESYPFRIYHRRLEGQIENAMPYHHHQNFQLIWCYEGEMAYLMMEKNIRINQHQLLFLDAGQAHASTPQSSSASYLLIEFSQEVLDEKIFASFIQPLLEHHIETSLTVELEPSLLGECLKLLDLPLGLRLDWQVNILLNLFFNHYQAMLTQKEQLGQYDQKKQAFDRMLSYIENHYNDTIYLEDIAQAGHVNASSCNQIFNQYADLSPVAYLNHYRLFRAKKLLEQSDWSVELIAHHTGFNHISHFIRQFKQTYGLTPLQYRKNK